MSFYRLQRKVSVVFLRYWIVFTERHMVCYFLNDYPCFGGPWRYHAKRCRNRAPAVALAHWLSNNSDGERRGIVLMRPATSAPIVRPFTRGTFLLFAVVLCAGCVIAKLSWPAMTWAVTNIQPPNTIRIAEATYGGSCGSRDVTAPVAYHCNGQAACDIPVAAGLLGEPIAGCEMSFAATWHCAGVGGTMRLAIVKDAGPKARASIACEPRSGGTTQ